jgi:hypothetical protein
MMKNKKFEDHFRCSPSQFIIHNSQLPPQKLFINVDKNNFQSYGKKEIEKRKN